MPFLFLMIALIVVITAIRGTHGTLASYLTQDLPGFMKWAFAIFAVLALGWLPGMRTVSRALLGLIAIVIVLTQWQAMLAGVSQLTGSATVAGTGATDVGAGAVAPAVTSGSATSLPSTASLTGNAPATTAAATPPPFNPFDPAQLLAPAETGFGGSSTQ